MQIWAWIRLLVRTDSTYRIERRLTAITRLIRFRWMHTKEERYNSRSTDPKRNDNIRKGKLDRVLWSEEPIDASGVVRSRRTVPVAVRRTTHCEKEATLGTFSTWWIIDRLGRERLVRILHTRHRHRYYRLADYTRKPCRSLRPKAHSRPSAHGRHILAEQELRFRRRNGTFDDCETETILTNSG